MSSWDGGACVGVSGACGRACAERVDACTSMDTVRVGRPRWGASAGWAAHPRLAIVAVNVLQVRDNALRVARVSRVNLVHRLVHRCLRCSGQLAKVEPLVVQLARTVQLAPGAARLHCVANEPDHLRLRRGRCRTQRDPGSRQCTRTNGCEIREPLRIVHELVGHERKQVTWKRRQRSRRCRVLEAAHRVNRRVAHASRPVAAPPSRWEGLIVGKYP